MEVSVFKCHITMYESPGSVEEAFSIGHWVGNVNLKDSGELQGEISQETLSLYRGRAWEMTAEVI